jgi:PAS domain S-box-containing protein
VQDITDRKQVEEALQKRESLLQKIFDILPVGLWFADKDGKLLRGNSAGVKIWGAEPKVAPAEYSVFKARRLPSGEEIAPEDWALVHTVRERVTVVDEMLEIDTFDGKKKVILNYTAPVLDDQGALQGAIVVNLDITSRKQTEEELRTSRLQLRALAMRLQQIREEERIMIAREIHDEMGGGLTGLKMDLSWLLRKMGDADPGEARVALMDKIHTSNALIDQMIHVVRRISADLRPSVLDDLGLVAALSWQAQEFTSRTEIQCEFVTSLDYVNLDDETATGVFRVFQEALTNVMRHSGATKVAVVLQEGERSLFGGESLVLEIRDNGRGITEEEILNPESLGLLGMKERVLAFGGELSIRGDPDGGTTLILKIPRIQGEPS